MLIILTLSSACSSLDPSPSPQTFTPEKPSVTATIPAQDTAVNTPTLSNTPTVQPTAEIQLDCRIGTGLRKETVEILLTFKNYPGLVMSSNLSLAEEYFSQLEGWVRVLGGPSLEVLTTKAARAIESQIAYEGLGYGLETSATTPTSEWKNLVNSTQKALDLSDENGKLLVMGPGFKIMSKNEESYPPMAALTDIWIFQTQRLQIHGPGETYRQEVERITNLIRSGNPNIKIWAQITFPPDQMPDPAEWLAFRESIKDLVDGTYIGVYIWNPQNTQDIQDAIISIYESACIQAENQP